MTVPALVISGFLGSGKTTLVAHILKQAQAAGVRLAIISNEFGDTGIDRALLDAGQDGLVELDGGCVCCKLSDALGETVEAVITKARPDRLILETSGVALPGEIVLNFWRPPIDELVSDTVVCVVVDALRLEELASDETFLDQLGAADLVVLNKCDLVDDDARRRAHERLAGLTDGQPVIDASFGRVSMDALFPPDLERRAPRPHTHEEHDHLHAQFETRTLHFPGVVDGDDLLAQLRAIGAIRAKGFVTTADGIRVIQGVGSRIELSEPTAEPPAQLIGMVVLIDRAGA